MLPVPYLPCSSPRLPPSRRYLLPSALVLAALQAAVGCKPPLQAAASECGSHGSDSKACGAVENNRFRCRCGGIRPAGRHWAASVQSADTPFKSTHCGPTSSNSPLQSIPRIGLGARSTLHGPCALPALKWPGQWPQGLHAPLQVLRQVISTSVRILCPRASGSRCASSH